MNTSSLGERIGRAGRFGCLAGLLFGGSAWCAESAAPITPPATYSDLFEDAVIARGKGFEVKRSQLDEAFIAFKANRAARGDRIPERERPVQEAQLLDRLIVTQLLLHRATDGDRTVARGLAEKFTADSKKGSPNDEAFYLQLKAMNMTPEMFQKRVLEQALSEAVIERELKMNVQVSDEQVRDFYETGRDLIVKLGEQDLAKMAADPKAKPGDVAEIRRRLEEMKKLNLSRLEQPERVRVAHVMISTRIKGTDEPLPEDQIRPKREQIEKIRQRALAGEDFLKLVKEYSEDRGLPQTGGIYLLARNDPFAPEFKTASFTLETNQISDVVQTRFGLHVIKLLDRLPAKKVEFDQAKSDLRGFLVQQEVQRRMPEYFARLKKEAVVEILDPKYRLEEVLKANRPGDQ